MVFGINTSPLAGRSGTFLTTRHLRERLNKNLNAMSRYESTQLLAQSNSVSGRGLLHLSVLIETMRREGFELSVGKPRVILRQGDSGQLELLESLVVEVHRKNLAQSWNLSAVDVASFSHGVTWELFTCRIFYTG